jgi:pimeloyl-ACP methyl ester carboxylesterase
MMDIQEQWLKVAGLRIHCLSAGESGSPVLLLHGGGSDSAHMSWATAMGPLAARHRVFAPDLPGCGESDRPDAAYTNTYYLDFIAALLDTLGLARTHLVGLSMGGALALGTTLQQPQRVARLVLVDSYGIQRTVAYHKISYLSVMTPGVMEATWAIMRRSRALAASSLSSIFADPAHLPAELVDEAYAEARKPYAGRAFTRYQRDELRWNGLRTVYLERLGEIRAPTLLIHGRQDKAVPLACAEEAQRGIAGARLHILEGAGHWAQREQPLEFNQALSDFLSD